MVLQTLLNQTHEEIPYIAQIDCKFVRHITPRRVRFDVEITVNSSSQQRILVGHQGRTLVKIRQAAATDLEQIFGKEVLLFLWIKLRKGTKNTQDES